MALQASRCSADSPTSSATSDAHSYALSSIPSYLVHSRPLNLLAAPAIYSMIVPIAVLDAWISLYQFLCFPLFGIRKVKRGAYIVVDRHKLTYLNGMEKPAFSNRRRP